MPELPEVETIVRQLAEHLPGRRVLHATVYRQDLLREPGRAFARGLEGRKIESVARRGKNILLHLSGEWVLLVNLGMTGRLLYRAGHAPDEVRPHLGIQFTLGPAGVLLYVDVRRFGHLIRYSKESWAEETKRLGPEPLGRGLTPSRFHAGLLASRTPVRSWLLDQRRIAGVGNIYAAESLFRARVHPARPARSLTREESDALLRGIRSVLREAVRARGTTLRDYRTARGETGGFGPALLVYGREGKPCPTCKTPIQRLVFANRSAFLCPCCQPESP